MPGKILGLEISKESVTAVQVTSGLKGYQITACGRVNIKDDGGLDEALKILSQQVALKSDTYLTSIPSEDISYRNLKMPFMESKKIRQTLPFEIETVVPLPVEDLVVDFNIIDQSDQSEILAASIKKVAISEYLEKLMAHGIDPDILDIRSASLVSWLLNQEGIPDSGLFLDIGEKSNIMVLYLNRRITLIRNHIYNGGAINGSQDDQDRDLTDTQTARNTESKLKSFCVMVQNTIHSFGWQNNKVIRPEKTFFTGIGSLDPVTGELLNRFLDTPVEQINLSNDKKVHMDYSIEKVWNPSLMDSALALALRDTKRGGGFNFRKDEFEIKKHYFGLKNEIRKVAAFLIIILMFLIIDFGVDYYFLNKRYKIANQNSTELFRQTFPDIKRIVNPVQQMKVKITELKKTDFMQPGIKANQKVLDLLNDISLRVPKSSDLHITSMVVDLETVRISGETDTFNTVDNIKSGLEPSEYFSAVTISSANLDKTGKRVNFEMKLQRTK